MHRIPPVPRTPFFATRRRLLAAALVVLLLPLAWIAGPAAHRMYGSAQDPDADPNQDPQQRTGHIVLLADPPLASYRGGVADLAPTTPAVLDVARLDVDSPASVAYLEHLAGVQRDAVTAVTNALGRDVDVLFRYRHALNGFAVELTPAEADAVRGLPGVLAVTPDFERRLVTDSGPAWIGAPAIWDGTAIPPGAGTGDQPGTRGEGIVVGVIDTGVNFDHPSFAAVGGDGYQHTNPRGRYYGLCAPLGGLPFCNDKLIGVHDFTGTTPIDDNGHGSHTASTAAGNVVPEAQLVAPTTTITRPVSGVAPHANLITYKACLLIGQCLGIPLVAAIDQAVADQVDVLNFSIGGGSEDPWANPDALAFLGARDAGILVIASAGNDGPAPATIGSPANSPWVLTVGAATHDRAFVSSLTDLTGGATPAPGTIEGRSVTGEYGPAPIVYAGDYGDPLCENPFLPTTFSGEIVICDRGVNPRVEKGRNVALGGAGGMVLANAEADGEATVADPHELPAVAIGYSDGVELKNWVAQGSGHQGRITATTVTANPDTGDVMAGFSSRGPNGAVPDILKPDIVAPGVDILAALHTDPTNPLAAPEFGLLSGTSMSGPHVTGSAALLRAVHPDWTPAEMISALVSTSHTTGLRKEDGATPADPFDAGAGRVDLTQAARAGLVLDVTAQDFRAANPAAGGDPAALNLATLAQQDCRGDCAWLRTVTNVLPTATTWRISGTGSPGSPGGGPALSVKPDVLRLAPGETASISITANVADLPAGDWTFGTVTLTPDNDSAAVQHLPVTVLPGGAPTPVDIETGSTAGSSVVQVEAPVRISDLSTTVLGLRQGEVTERQLPQDPTPLEPYDGSVGSFHITVDVPEGAPLFSAEILTTTSRDLDLYVGLDTNGNGAPDAYEQLCISAGGTSAESCQLDNPTGGTYWVMVRNFLTGQGLDDVTLQTVVVPPDDHGNLTADGPDGALRPGELFPVELRWDEPALRPGTTWFGLVRLGSAADRTGDVGSLLVRLHRPPG